MSGPSLVPIFALLALDRNGMGPLADSWLNEARQDVHARIISGPAVADARR